MKKSALLLVALVVVLMTRCQCKPTPAENNNQPTDSIPLDTIVDSTMWGRMGDGTAMSVVEFITEKGDTLYLPKTNQITGEDAELMGDIRNFNDKFAVTINGCASDEMVSLATCVNVSEMMGQWKSGNTTLSLYVDGNADQTSGDIKGWKMCNGRLVLKGQVSTEYGTTERYDTMTILYLDEDSLHLYTPQHETLKFGR